MPERELGLFCNGKASSSAVDSGFIPCGLVRSVLSSFFFNFTHDFGNPFFLFRFRLKQRRKHGIAADAFQLQPGFQAHCNAVETGVNFVDMLDGVDFFLPVHHLSEVAISHLTVAVHIDFRVQIGTGADTAGDTDADRDADADTAPDATPKASALPGDAEPET